MKDAAELIEKLAEMVTTGDPTRSDAAKLAPIVGYPIGTLKTWKHRKAIPSYAWPMFIWAAGELKMPGVTAESMLALHHPQET